MSNWTHVAAVFRVDDIEANPQATLDEVFKRECIWEGEFPRKVFADQRKHPEDYLPMGSEGSLHKSIWVNPDKSAMARYVVTIWGDLRDHDSIDEIGEWFTRCCKKLKWTCRQAVCTVRNEYLGEKVFTYEFGQYDQEDQE